MTSTDRHCAMTCMHFMAPCCDSPFLGTSKEKQRQLAGESKEAKQLIRMWMQTAELTQPLHIRCLILTWLTWTEMHSLWSWLVCTGGTFQGPSGGSSNVQPDSVLKYLLSPVLLPPRAAPWQSVVTATLTALGMTVRKNWFEDTFTVGCSDFLL